MTSANITWHLLKIQLSSISLQESVTNKIDYNTAKAFHLCFSCFIPSSFGVMEHCIYLKGLSEHSDNYPAGHATV